MHGPLHVIAPRFAADAQLVEVSEHVGRVGVDPERAGSLELLEAVAAREQPDAERTGAPSSQQVLDAVADDHRVLDRQIEQGRGRRGTGPDRAWRAALGRG